MLEMVAGMMTVTCSDEEEGEARLSAGNTGKPLNLVLRSVFTTVSILSTALNPTTGLFITCTHTRTHTCHRRTLLLHLTVPGELYFDPLPPLPKCPGPRPSQPILTTVCASHMYANACLPHCKQPAAQFSGCPANRLVCRLQYRTYGEAPVCSLCQLMLGQPSSQKLHGPPTTGW